MSTVGLEEAVMRHSIRPQEAQEKRAEHLALGDCAPQRSGTYTQGSEAVPQPPAGASCNSALGEGSCNSALSRGLPTTVLPTGAYHNSAPSRGISNYPLCGVVDWRLWSSVVLSREDRGLPHLPHTLPTGLWMGGRQEK